ncbi:MAG: DMT family transporter [Deltaproteobacteria bacterium]|nr:DMT family transporter [Deltaproteobacteria bacterium]
MIALYVILTIGNGALITISRSLNSALGTRIGHLEGSLVNHLGGMLCGAVLLIVGVRTGTWHGGLPFYYYLGGCCGVILVAASNYAIPRVGSVVITILLTMAQLTATAWMDHNGWLGGRVIPFRWTTLCGMALLIGGALLTHPKPSTRWNVTPRQPSP